MTVNDCHRSVRRAAGALLFVAVGLCLPGSATAAPVECVGQSLDQLIGLGSDGCGSLDRQVYDFSYTVTATGGATEVSAEDVVVDSWIGCCRFSGGISFVGDWRVGPDQTLLVQIAYSFRMNAVGAFPWYDGDYDSPAGPDSIFRAGIACLSDTFPCDSGTLVALGGRFPLASTGGIRTFALLDGRSLEQGQPDSRVRVRSLTDYYLVPEPPIPMLLVLGLSVLWMRIRSRSIVRLKSAGVERRYM
jgi:hypothetical protein